MDLHLTEAKQHWKLMSNYQSKSPASLKMAPYNNEQARWHAVMARDPAASNAFVYTVSSTGIYCRPTCPARLARRANVGFYDHASEAAALGYRPCKRCKPEVGGGQPEDAAVTAIRTFIASQAGTGKSTTLRKMADQAGLSKWRKFCSVNHVTYSEHRFFIYRFVG
jgi:methylphosphotriester-DNA--protein-cysteine methyltransferase